MIELYKQFHAYGKTINQIHSNHGNVVVEKTTPSFTRLNPKMAQKVYNRMSYTTVHQIVERPTQTRCQREEYQRIQNPFG